MTRRWKILTTQRIIWIIGCNGVLFHSLFIIRWIHEWPRPFTVTTTTTHSLYDIPSSSRTKNIDTRQTSVVTSFKQHNQQSYSITWREPSTKIVASLATSLSSSWPTILSNASEPPYTDMAPRMDVVWSRGWYNAVPLPPTIPMEYYNTHGRGDIQTPDSDMARFLPTPDVVCQTGYLWLRGSDVLWFVQNILTACPCQNLTIITSDCASDAPHGIQGFTTILRSSKVQSWYTQNLAVAHPKLIPIPLGLPIHYGVDPTTTRNSLETIQTMKTVRLRQISRYPYVQRQRSTIFFDRGTMGGSARRTREREQATVALASCSNIHVLAQPLPTIKYWETMSTYSFAVAVTGVGWDTFRIWELLFFGTVPIVKRSPLTDYLLEPAHVPVLIVDEWDEICNLSSLQMHALGERYLHWIANAQYWLQPSSWIPRNETFWETLCDDSPGCRNGHSIPPHL